MLLKTLSPLLSCLVFSHGVVSMVLPREVLPRDDNAADNLTWINHDAVVPFPQKASEVGGALELRFNPLLYVEGGCDPYPAVDEKGELGSGLKPTKGGRSGCDKGGKGQVYVRRGKSQGHNAIMYSYYMPKLGREQRHSWVSIVVWTHRYGCDDNDPSSVWPVGISYTTDHLEWGATSGKVSFKSSPVGLEAPTHPKLQVHDGAISPFDGADGDLVYERTLISWSSLSDEARKALEDVHYDKTEVPFNNANIQNSLEAAFQVGFYAGSSAEPECPTSDVPPGDDWIDSPSKNTPIDPPSDNTPDELPFDEDETDSPSNNTSDETDSPSDNTSDETDSPSNNTSDEQPFDGTTLPSDVDPSDEHKDDDPPVVVDPDVPGTNEEAK
ncbi:NPP1 domain-containing protein [Colletotrichum orchidophilum]|uniref:NPP1 domain-containing protein n=1 Tax=Colletotrichum orchidophilum TaxID=1209926 RepID=A0A1G4BMI9_9PEZI|nr:NPP1 domain-containing protein [Colletotrichum orchidophilum]OHF02503.1 NPP1 domain-containing protein [Colletotrichum orchidophilum]